ncbi:monovalent cation/H(+) antiporter subunit G [Paracoccus sp. (in: a-proteobacteria)]|uniref:monovalent cation/H(+) antiporter subunit G n=1 Tax=Paracoccus sp. TaxID=267 RepID=UPI00396CE58D
MNTLNDVPLWLALLVSAFVVLGATLTLIGAYGFLRLRSFYDRLHAPTLATSWGTGGVILASVLLASHVQGRPVLHELVVGLAVVGTVPVTLMLLGRAALHRDRTENAPELPSALRVSRSAKDAPLTDDAS